MKYDCAISVQNVTRVPGGDSKFEYRASGRVDVFRIKSGYRRGNTDFD